MTLHIHKYVLNRGWCIVRYNMILKSVTSPVSSHFNLWGSTSCLDQLFPLRTTTLVFPAHLILCAVKSIILCFIHHFPSLYRCFCQSLRPESLFTTTTITTTTSCVVKISISRARFHSSPACFTRLFSQMCLVLFFSLLRTGSWTACVSFLGVCVFSRTLRVWRSCWACVQVACSSTETGWGSTGSPGPKS